MMRDKPFEASDEAQDARIQEEAEVAADIKEAAPMKVEHGAEDVNGDMAAARRRHGAASLGYSGDDGEAVAAHTAAPQTPPRSSGAAPPPWRRKESLGSAAGAPCASGAALVSRGSAPWGREDGGNDDDPGGHWTTSRPRGDRPWSQGTQGWNSGKGWQGHYRDKWASVADPPGERRPREASYGSQDGQEGRVALPEPPPPPGKDDSWFTTEGAYYEVFPLPQSLVHYAKELADNLRKKGCDAAIDFLEHSNWSKGFAAVSICHDDAEQVDKASRGVIEACMERNVHDDTVQVSVDRDYLERLSIGCDEGTIRDFMGSISASSGVRVDRDEKAPTRVYVFVLSGSAPKVANARKLLVQRVEAAAAVAAQTPRACKSKASRDEASHHRRRRRPAELVKVDEVKRGNASRSRSARGEDAGAIVASARARALAAFSATSASGAGVGGTRAGAPAAGASAKGEDESSSEYYSESASPTRTRAPHASKGQPARAEPPPSEAVQPSPRALTAPVFSPPPQLALTAPVFPRPALALMAPVFSPPPGPAGAHAASDGSAPSLPPAFPPVFLPAAPKALSGGAAESQGPPGQWKTVEKPAIGVIALAEALPPAGMPLRRPLRIVRGVAPTCEVSASLLSESLGAPGIPLSAPLGAVKSTTLATASPQASTQLQVKAAGAATDAPRCVPPPQHAVVAEEMARKAAEGGAKPKSASSSGTVSMPARVPGNWHKDWQSSAEGSRGAPVVVAPPVRAAVEGTPALKIEKPAHDVW